ncbi:MAG: hypothetical protein U0Y68_24855 [Blastocatellia bacterium]
MSRINGQLWIYLQSVQAYVSPPIAVVFLLGVFWKRINGQGAITALLAGFVLGAARFILEVYFAGEKLTGFFGWFVGMNFLHFAILLFAVCVGILIVVSLLTPAPAPEKVAGLTLQTVREKISLAEVESDSIFAVPLEPETSGQRKMNMLFAGVLVVTVVSLWIYFA